MIPAIWEGIIFPIETEVTCEDIIFTKNAFSLLSELPDNELKENIFDNDLPLNNVDGCALNSNDSLAL